MSGTGEDLELRRQRLFERLRAEVEAPPQDTQESEPATEETPPPDEAYPTASAVERHPQPVDLGEVALHEPDMVVEDSDAAVAEVVEPEYGAEVAEDSPPPEDDERSDFLEGSGDGGGDAAQSSEDFMPSEVVVEAHQTPEQAPEADPLDTDEVTEAPSAAEEPEEAAPQEPDEVIAEAQPGTPEPPKLARPALPRILAVANQKGGVGKTTTTVNLGAGLAEIGYRVLVIDLDPQGNATTGLGINGRNLEVSIYDVLLHETPMEDCVEPTSLKNLFVIPATIDLAGAEIELVPAFSRELRLRKALGEIIEDFDFVLIDCPPSLGLLTVNGLAAATEVLVPIQCEYYALEGLGQLLRNVDLVHQNLNPQLHLSTIVMTMFDARTKLADQVVNDVRSHFGEKVCRNIIPRTVRLSEAPSFGQPITLFDPTSRGAIAYRELAKEVSGGAPQRTG